MRYYFARSFIKLRGHTSWQNDDLNPILSRNNRPVAAIKSPRFALFHYCVFTHCVYFIIFCQENAMACIIVLFSYTFLCKALDNTMVRRYASIGELAFVLIECFSQRMHTSRAMLCFVVVKHQAILPISFRVTTKAPVQSKGCPVPMKQHWQIGINISFGSSKYS